MKSVEQMLDDIIRREGGYVNDPKDRGGATNFGVSLLYARGKPEMDLNRDGKIDAKDIRMVTVPLARKLYKEDFFLRPKLHTLPEPLHAQLFDISVNSGPGKALVLLQRVLKSLGYNIAVDGRIGNQTRTAAEQACAKFGWKRVNNDLVQARLNFYNAIIARNSSQSRFRKGWTNRAKEFLA